LLKNLYALLYFVGLKITCGIKARFWIQRDAFVVEVGSALIDQVYLGSVIKMGLVGAFAVDIRVKKEEW
jgi:hypothetical protein